MLYRAFYTPKTGKYREVFVDADTLEELPSGAIFVIKRNEDGTREIISDEKKNRKLSPKEERYHTWAQRQLEFKHDGGPTPEMILYLREHRS